MSGIVFKRGGVPTAEAPVTAFVPETPCEQAWADLRDGTESADVERIMASIGGWEAWEGREIPYLAFVGAFNGEPEHAQRVLAKRLAAAVTA